jgi:hypothetical protein
MIRPTTIGLSCYTFQKIYLRQFRTVCMVFSITVDTECNCKFYVRFGFIWSLILHIYGFNLIYFKSFNCVYSQHDHRWRIRMSVFHIVTVGLLLNAVHTCCKHRVIAGASALQSSSTLQLTALTTKQLKALDNRRPCLPGGCSVLLEHALVSGDISAVAASSASLIRSWYRPVSNC